MPLASFAPARPLLCRPAMPPTQDDLAHLGAEVLAAVARHHGPWDATPAAIAAWLDERLELAAIASPPAIEVVDARGWRLGDGTVN